ncbi:MAG: PaaI family thioesterase [Caulobacteraceae bacterium]
MNAPSPSDLAGLAHRMASETPQAAALGLRTVSVEPGIAVMKVAWRADLVGDPATGVLAGGVITTLLDHVSGMAVASGHFGGCATLDLRIDYMRPAEPGRDVLGRAHCYKQTATIAFVRAAAYESDPDDPIATAQAAFVINPAPATAVA